MQWWWWRWWWYRRRTRPSEASIEAARSAVYSVRRRLKIASSSAATTTLATEAEEEERGELRELGDDNDNEEENYGGGEESADDGGGDAGGEVGREVDDDYDDVDDVGEGRPIDDRRPLLSPKSFGSDDASCDPAATAVPRSSPARRSSPSRFAEAGEEAAVAARLAEGALRAYRDLTLDEATELHYALHHWTQRWADPLLARLEAGPGVWWSDAGGGGGSGGDRRRRLPPHVEAGKKVGQIQAVLARRCAVIGELQQHLWRASWQGGVANWGVLGGGVGGEWTSVRPFSSLFVTFPFLSGSSFRAAFAASAS